MPKQEINQLAIKTLLELHVISLFTMKKTLTYLQILFFISCSSLKIDKDVINDFVEEQVKNEKNYKEIIIIEEAISRKKTIEVYEKSWKEKLRKPFLSKKVIPINQNYKNEDWPIDSLEIIQLKSKFVNDSLIKWKENDFDNSKFKIIKYASMKDNNFTDSFINKSVIAYQISKPILCSNKENILIYIYSFDVGLGVTQTRSSYLLKKINGKWKSIIRFDEDIYN